MIRMHGAASSEVERVSTTAGLTTCCRPVAGPLLEPVPCPGTRTS
jgi:hypothetical protein